MTVIPVIKNDMLLFWKTKKTDVESRIGIIEILKDRIQKGIITNKKMICPVEYQGCFSFVFGVL